MRFGPIPRQLQRFLISSKQLAITEACVIGVVSGLAAVLLKQGVGWLGGLRVQASHEFPAWIVLPLIGLVGGLLSGFLVERLAPEAAGSGIPQVKAALSNVAIALDLRVALVKLVSVILSVGSGLNLGRQGPTVQVGAALAAQLSRWVPTSPEYRRQLIAAGAAAGLAAGFNAPIAGILFVVEEFIQDFSDLTLGTAILASFIGAVVSRVLGGQGLSLDLDIGEIHASASLQDIPFLFILGLLAGLLGALLTRGIFISLKFNRDILRWPLPWRIGLAGGVSGLIMTLLPIAFRDNTGLQEFLSSGDAEWQVTLLAFVVKFLLALIAYGSGAPGGLFAPSLILGSALGDLVGTTAMSLETWVGIPLGLAPGISDPSTYALAGMGAFFSAVTRGPITAIVIVFEITTDFNLVLPLMIGSVVAYLVADRLGRGSFYGQLLSWNGIHIEKDADSIQTSWADLHAADLMQRRVETLSSQMTLAEAKQAFSQSHHRGFPVIEQDQLVGIVTQSDLTDASRQLSQEEETRLKDIMTPNPVAVNPTDPLNHVLYLLNRYKLSRLPVIDGQKLVGIITRADIIRAEADQVNGKSQPLGPQPEPSYAIYQTRSPATGRGRILVPLSNPQTASSLIKMAGAIAQARQFELECLHVIVVPIGDPPAETAVSTTRARRLMRQAEQLGRHLNVPTHTQIRVAHDITHAILETIQERNIDLILTGWKGATSTPGRIFSNAVDTLIRQAPCEVIVVKFNESEQFNRWLVPIAGGPNAQKAVYLLPALIALSNEPEISICQVFGDEPVDAETELLQKTVRYLKVRLDCRVSAKVLRSQAISNAIVQLAWLEQSDVVMVGASREGLLQQVIKGNIPEAIARDVNRTVILVRGAIDS